MTINYFTEDISVLPDFETQAFQAWVHSLTSINILEINYIFCSDAHLLSINQEYLQHDYHTDIITFVNSDEGQPIESDIFISVDRVKENAEKYSFGNFANEIHRVMAHGVLHLMGFGDKTESQIVEMRAQEALALEFINQFVSRETKP